MMCSISAFKSNKRTVLKYDLKRSRHLNRCMKFNMTKCVTKVCCPKDPEFEPVKNHSFLSLIYLPPCFFCFAWINFSCVNRNLDSKFLFFSITFSRIVSFDSPDSLSFKISSLRTVFNLRLINDAVRRIEVSAIKWGASYQWLFCPWSALAVWRRRPSRRRNPL